MPVRPVHVALLFHCNQAISSFAQIAAENCYRGLVRVLRRHPRAGLNFHWSGSLLASLQWWYPDLVRTIRRELARGRWEALVSTYAQNVPFTGPASLNRLALGVHRAALRAAFPEWTPRGYWISERSWRPEMAREIASAGLEYTLIEDHILADSGCGDLFRPRRIVVGPNPPRPPSPGGRGEDLVVFTDDEDFKHIVNHAIWTGETKPVMEYLRGVRDSAPDLPPQRSCGGMREGPEQSCGGMKEEALPPIVTYAEDGEASGLWAAERGCPPQIVWEHLDRLLSTLERERWIRLTRLSDYLDRHREAIPRETRRIGRGQARWMCASLANPNLPYHEDGYADWFDFNRRSDKIRRFRPIFRRAARTVLDAEPRTPAARRLAFQAALNVAAHAFEFGCIGIGHRRGRLWERHRVAHLPLSLMNLPPSPRGRGVGGVRSDLNRDRRPEYAVLTDGLLSLWSPRTGALLYLFDLPTGDEFVGNELASGSIFGLGYEDDVIPDGRAPEPAWSGFRSARQRLADFRGLWRDVPRDESWMRWLIDWSALPEPPATIRQVALPREQCWELENGRRDRACVTPSHRVRQRALVERLTVDGEVVLDVAALSRDPKARGRFKPMKSGFEITHKAGPVTLTKRVTQTGHEICVEYVLVNESTSQRVNELTITSEWVPSYLTLVLFGRESLEVTPTGARNTLTGSAIEFTINQAMKKATAAAPGVETEARQVVHRGITDVQLGLLDTRRLCFGLGRRETRRVAAHLRLTPGHHFDQMDHITERGGGS